MKKSTNRDPAFLFYSSDFLMTCADLIMEERGQYITLFCLQHQHGHLSRKIIDLNIPDISDEVLKKLSVDKDGKYYDKNLETAIKNRKEYSQKQRERALKRWGKTDMPRHENGTSQNDTETMPIINENENVIVIKNKNDIDIYSYIESNFGRTLAATEINGINDWKEIFSDDMIMYAVDISVRQSIKKFAYINGILNNWKSQNYETLEQVKNAEQKFKTIEHSDVKELFDYDWLNDDDVC